MEEAAPDEIITAGAILMLLVCGVWDEAKLIEDREELSGKIQTKCSFNKNLQKLLKKNPFMTKESIREFYEKKLKEYLDSEFEEYCTCDDYYEPVVED